MTKEKTFSIIEDVIEKDLIHEDTKGNLKTAVRVKLKPGYGCPHCQCIIGVVFPYGPHYELDCDDCGARIRWVPKEPRLRENLEAVQK